MDRNTGQRRRSRLRGHRSSPWLRGAAFAVLVAATAWVSTPAPGVAASDPPSNGWETTTPASAGMDAAVLDGARDFAFQPGRNTQGVVVVRGGRIVDEWYAPGEGPESWSASWSMAKSVTSALIGIAIEQGRIASVDEPLSTWFPEWAGTAKGAITLQDALHMESGLDWNEDYNVSAIERSDIIRMGLSADQLDYARSRPIAAPPGTRFHYSSGDTMLLSGVLQAATGMPADEFARRYLFDPLGIRQVEWWRDAEGHTLTYCCLDMPSRDFARIGLLYLRGGNWNGTQVLAESWVRASFEPTEDSDGGYGNMWWTGTMPEVEGRIYYAVGFDGQWTYVIPSLDLVVVRNGDYTKSWCPPVADPNLFGRYPPAGLSAEAGTRPPASWNEGDFLRPIVESVTGPPTGEAATPDPEDPPRRRDPEGQRMAPCPAAATITVSPETTTPPATAPPARAVVARARYTG